MPKVPPQMSSNQTAKLVGLFFLALLLFNFPILGLFGKAQFVLGLPVFYVYVFVVWIILIFLLQRLMHRPKNKARTD